MRFRSDRVSAVAVFHFAGGVIFICRIICSQSAIRASTALLWAGSKDFTRSAGAEENASISADARNATVSEWVIGIEELELIPPISFGPATVAVSAVPDAFFSAVQAARLIMAPHATVVSNRIAHLVSKMVARLELALRYATREPTLTSMSWYRHLVNTDGRRMVPLDSNARGATGCGRRAMNPPFRLEQNCLLAVLFSRLFLGAT